MIVISIKLQRTFRAGSLLYNPQKNIQYIATQAYKVKNGLSLIITKDLFQFSKNAAYELRKLRSDNHLQRTNIPNCTFW